ncbi:piggyBac transposable element-derived protein 3-like [Palaemon carinicauda]|uniref:piggyBac transposable element-derived protein 3-like n=1 Tax=Palaemon carinicauda TaxID=392227 RepID=UPI0035B69406
MENLGGGGWRVAVTDEDSGEEEDVDINNLPGAQMTSQALISGEALTEGRNKKTSKKICKVRHWCSEVMEQIDSNSRQLFYGPSTADFPRTPPEIFELFLDTAAIELLTIETVKYATQNGNHQSSLSCNEMKIFVVILLLSGYCFVSRHGLYWSTELDTHNDLISNSMRRNRFEEIMRYFHAADNTDLNPADKFAKVRPFLDILNKNYLSYGKVFGPSTVSTDEFMIPYFVRHSTKQFISGKPIRWGYKAWAACTPLGYAFTLDLYQGKYEGNNPSVYAIEYRLGEKVVLNILDTLQEISEGKRINEVVS